MNFRIAAAVLAAVFIACAGEGALPAHAVADSARADSVARARQDSINRAQPGYIVDSILPLDEEIRRFKAAVGGDSVTALQHAGTSREALVRRFVAAVVANDSTDLRAMLLSPREFIDLVYPSSPYAGSPYNEAPGRIWMLIANPSETGLTRIVRRLGGQPLAYVDHQCDPTPDRQGRNIIWTGCLLHIREADGAIGTHRYFGSILERDGRFKFVSYTNEF